MLIDFAQAHAKWLVGKSENIRWVFEPVNLQNPLAGKHLASHQIFSNNALGVAVYLRNEIADDGKAVAVFSALKLSFSHKAGARYLLNNDPEKVSLSLDIGGVRQLYTWLQGSTDTFRVEIARKGAPPKAIYGFRLKGGQFSRVLKASATLGCGKQVIVDVGLGYGDLFALSMYCVGFAKLLYPAIDSQVIERLLTIPGESVGLKHSESEPELFPHAKTFSVDDLPTMPSPEHSQPLEAMRNTRGLELRAVATPPDAGLIRAQKAIFAVGINKWPQKCRSVIEYIQSGATLEAMDRLIKAGNAGDFTEWNRIAVFCQNNQ